MMEVNGHTVDSHNVQLQNEVEELREELHSLNIKYSSKIAVEKDAAEEIEILHRNLEEEKSIQRNLVLKFEEELKLVKKTWKDEIENLKSELTIQANNDAERIEQLEKEITLTKGRLVNEAESSLHAKQAFEVLSETLNEETKKREKAESALKMLELKLGEMEQKLAEALEIKGIKEEEIISLKERLTQAEEEVALCNSQMRELQVPNLNDCEPGAGDDASSKGNSLFAEVDDRRQLMKQQLVAEKNKNVGLKRAYKAKCSQVQHLQAQLTDVTRKWKEDAKDTISSQDSLIASLRSRIKELEETQMIQSPVLDDTRHREFMGRVNGDNLDEYKFMEMELENGREEIKKLKENLNQLSICKLLSDEEMYKIKAELRRLRAENAHLMRTVYEQKLVSSRNDKCLEGLMENGEK
ncbi:protein Spindly [Ischnura elegans]|uniref:protein Spindly n=1 Tax=Ischnura elegans TaxID=197161 RepID=UPI001ED88E5A|nr:protein Spindly [Ischnura elegans]